VALRRGGILFRKDKGSNAPEDFIEMVFKKRIKIFIVNQSVIIGALKITLLFFGTRLSFGLPLHSFQKRAMAGWRGTIKFHAVGIATASCKTTRQ